MFLPLSKTFFSCFLPPFFLFTPLLCAPWALFENLPQYMLHIITAGSAVLISLFRKSGVPPETNEFDVKPVTGASCGPHEPFWSTFSFIGSNRNLGIAWESNIFISGLVRLKFNGTKEFWGKKKGRPTKSWNLLFGRQWLSAAKGNKSINLWILWGDRVDSHCKTVRPWDHH